MWKTRGKDWISLNFPGLLEIAGEREIKGEREKKREWSSGHPWDSPNLELRTLLGGLMSPFFPHVTKQPRSHIVIYDTIVWISLIWFPIIVHTSPRCSPVSRAGVTWITYTGYLFLFVGLTLALRICDYAKGMVLASFVFLLFYFGLYLKSGHYSLSAGRPLLVIHLSRNKNK